mmetsp:Transcript_29210/g.69737  ORF Transcript_29210/g.69737 Transcript_29210/m.69737 type:complete len:201 (+) Transcript_29210:217-819(+)
MRRKAEDVTTGPASVSKYFKNNLIQDKLPALSGRPADMTSSVWKGLAKGSVSRQPQSVSVTDQVLAEAAPPLQLPSIRAPPVQGFGSGNLTAPRDRTRKWVSEPRKEALKVARAGRHGAESSNHGGSSLPPVQGSPARERTSATLRNVPSPTENQAVRVRSSICSGLLFLRRPVFPNSNCTTTRKANLFSLSHPCAFTHP